MGKSTSTRKAPGWQARNTPGGNVKPSRGSTKDYESMANANVKPHKANSSTKRGTMKPSSGY